jgi:hypothetical protein
MTVGHDEKTKKPIISREFRLADTIAFCLPAGLSFRNEKSGGSAAPCQGDDVPLHASRRTGMTGPEAALGRENG